jgi:hypothetical protein
LTNEMVAQLVFDCAANVPNMPQHNIDKTMDLWAREFKDYPDDLVYTAVHLHIDYEKGFPTVADIKKNIRELRKEDKPSLPDPRSRQMAPAVAKALATVAKEGFKEAFSKVDVSDVMDAARVKFPDISEELVRKNYCELSYYMRAIKTCSACRWDKSQCPISGAIPSPYMRSDGTVINEVTLCQKGMKPSEAVLQIKGAGIKQIGK